MDKDASNVPISKVVLALVVHRLIAPGSKTAAVRWFDRTALADLIGTTPSALNNSRLHRALRALDEVRPELQLGLSELYRDSTEEGGVVFLDVTDTWFEGRGPSVAQRHKTKEGVFKKKIGIVLSVNKHGDPLRWAVVAGRRHDSQTMGDMARLMAQIPWLADLAVVFDRAMGKAAHLQELTDAGVRFLTLMTKESYEGYASEELAVPELDSIKPVDENDEDAQAAAIHAMRDAGFEKVGRQLWAKDLGVRRSRRASRRKKSGAVRRPYRRTKPHKVAAAMQQAQQLDATQALTGATYLHIGKELGIGRGKLVHLRKLMKLRPEIQEVVAQGLSSASLDDLEKLALLDPTQQLACFEQYRLGGAPKVESEEVFEHAGPPLRLTLAFDPVAFVVARAKAERQDREIREEAERLSHRILGGATTPSSADRTMNRVLKKQAMSDCYRFVVSLSGVDLVRDEQAWHTKRRTDGMRLLAQHPDLQHSPERVVQLYSAVSSHWRERAVRQR